MALVICHSFDEWELYHSVVSMSSHKFIAQEEKNESQKSAFAEICLVDAGAG